MIKGARIAFIEWNCWWCISCTRCIMSCVYDMRNLVIASDSLHKSSHSWDRMNAEKFNSGTVLKRNQQYRNPLLCYFLAVCLWNMNDAPPPLFPYYRSLSTGLEWRAAMLKCFGLCPLSQVEIITCQNKFWAMINPTCWELFFNKLFKRRHES